MATFAVEWKPGGPMLKLAVAMPIVNEARPAKYIDFDVLVDTGYDLSMVIPERVNALKLHKIRDGASHSPLCSSETTIHLASLWHQGELIANNAEVSSDNPRVGEGLLGQNVLLNHVLEQMGPGKQCLVHPGEGGGPAVVTGHAYPSGPKVLLSIGPAIAKGQQPPHRVKWQCVLDTGAGKGIIAPTIRKTLKLVQTGRRKINNGKVEKEYPEYRVSVWHDNVCLVPNLPVAELQPQGSPILLGQDFLHGCLFTQDGPSRLVQLEF
ncbi:MAG: hypothetical protein NTY19_04280 [Planctomycetota bacterium]|nr:hypothetical protein [Planctomycetota bacterium]